MITINSSNKVELPKNETVKTITVTPNTATVQQPAPVAVAPIQQTTQPATNVCVIMGPFNAEKKGMMDFILNRYKQADLAKVEKKRIYQIFWDLGTDKDVAKEMFYKQKEGPMADQKFVLQQNDNQHWIVNIVKVNGSSTIADKLAGELSAKAKKINTGGTWEYRVLPEGYFYTFPDFKKVNDATINQIDTLLSPTKEPC